ncbi:MAG TPA: CPBP family intramembrane glutamic endopeptidase [Thermoanaerobaculia bacterium]|nr:CPBP family intramembrane glutamic endopeptidase [Thermoanaerobaculia bacterium]
MRAILQRLSPRGEFWLVLVLAFGYFVVRSTMAFFAGSARVLTTRWAVSLVAYEIIMLAIVIGIAKARGWSWRELAPRPTLLGTIGGLVLSFGCTMLVSVSYLVTSIFVRVPKPPITSQSLALWAIVLIALINPIFEEALVVGYVVRMTGARGAAFAITVSALLRLAYHTYQGPSAVISIFPVGILFAAIYAKYRDLWPIVVAHAVLDYFSLSRL